MATLKAGRPRAIMPLSKMTAACAATVVGGEKVEDRVSAGLLLAVADEAHVDGQLARGGQLARRGEQQVQLPLVVGDAAARTGTHRGSPARTAATPTARADRAAGRRSARSRARSGRGRRRCEARSSPTASGCPCQSISSAARRRPHAGTSHTHSPAWRTSPACAGSALTEGMRSSSASSSNQSDMSATLAHTAEPAVARPIADVRTIKVWSGARRGSRSSASDDSVASIA